MCDLGKMRTKVPCYLKLFNSRYGKIVPGQYISVYCYAAGEVRPSTTARRNLRSCPASSWQQDGNVGSIMRNASPHGCQLAKLACRPHKHVEGMEVAPSNCLTRPSITASRHCVAPAKDNVQTGQRCGARLKSGSSHNGSRPPQAGKKKPPGKSCTLINSKVALPAIGLQCNRLEALNVLGPKLPQPGTFETTMKVPPCCVKRRTQGRIRRCRSSWHGLVEASQGLMKLVGVDDAWLQNVLLPYADCMYG